MSDKLHLHIFLIYVYQKTLQISAEISGNFSTKNNLFLSFNIPFCSHNQTTYYSFEQGFSFYVQLENTKEMHV